VSHGCRRAAFERLPVTTRKAGSSGFEFPIAGPVLAESVGWDLAFGSLGWRPGKPEVAAGTGISILIASASVDEVFTDHGSGIPYSRETPFMFTLVGGDNQDIEKRPSPGTAKSPVRFPAAPWAGA
jgi:hypothetical protein